MWVTRITEQRNENGDKSGTLTTTFSKKQKTSEAKFNENRQNLDSDSKKGKQNYKQSKNVE